MKKTGIALVNYTKLYFHTTKKIKTKVGHCPRCLSANIVINGKRFVCLNCNDWAWIDDSKHSCWRGEQN